MRLRRRDQYTKEQIDYLIKIADQTGRSNKEITEMFNLKFNQNKAVTAIISIKSRWGIKSYTKAYTKEHLDYLRMISPGKSGKKITEMFNEKFNQNRTELSIKRIRHEKGIVTGITGYFEKEQLPHNTLPIGAEITREDGYIYVKVANPNVWKQKHHIIWEEHNGPIPEGYVILFGDRNTNNLNIDNLICIGMDQLLMMNKYKLIYEDIDFTRVGISIANLYLKRGELK